MAKTEAEVAEAFKKVLSARDREVAVLEAAKKLLSRVKVVKSPNGYTGYRHLSYFATYERVLLAAVEALNEANH